MSWQQRFQAQRLDAQQRPPTRYLALPFWRVAAIGSAVVYLVMYCCVALARLTYPFELEWIEGGIVDATARIAQGLPLYVKPSLDYTPWLYAPVFFYLGSWVTRIVGGGFMPLRMISLLASLGCFAFIFIIVRKETHRWVPAVIAAGLYAATYRAGGAWFDMARVDSLFLVLLLASAYCLRFCHSSLGLVFAAVLAALAAFTKQTALVILAPLSIYYLAVHRARFLPFAAVFGGIMLGVNAWMNHITSGWSNYYMWSMPGQHRVVREMVVLFYSQDILQNLAIAVAISLFYLGAKLRRRDDSATFHFLFASGCVLGAWFSRLHEGGYTNVVLPAFVAIAILAGLGLGAALDMLEASGGHREVIESTIWAACVLQFATLAYNPLHQIPTKKDQAAGQKLVRMLADAPGDVLVLDHGYFATLAGKRPSAHAMAIADILRADENEIKKDLVAEIREKLSRKPYSLIILDRPSLESFDMYYRPTGRVYSDNLGFWPVTGRITRPDLIYVPR